MVHYRRLTGDPRLTFCRFFADDVPTTLPRAAHMNWWREKGAWFCPRCVAISHEVVETLFAITAETPTE